MKSKQTQVHESIDIEHDDLPCPFGDPICSGISGLFFGTLSCWSCYQLAPADAIGIQNVWAQMERRGGEHPALSGGE